MSSPQAPSGVAVRASCRSRSPCGWRSALCKILNPSKRLPVASVTGYSLWWRRASTSRWCLRTPRGVVGSAWPPAASGGARGGWWGSRCCSAPSLGVSPQGPGARLPNGERWRFGIPGQGGGLFRPRLHTSSKATGKHSEELVSYRETLKLVVVAGCTPASRLRHASLNLVGLHS